MQFAVMNFPVKKDLELLAQAQYNPPWIPPALTGTTPDGTTTCRLTLAASPKQLMPGATTATDGYNGRRQLPVHVALLHVQP